MVQNPSSELNLPLEITLNTIGLGRELILPGHEVPLGKVVEPTGLLEL